MIAFFDQETAKSPIVESNCLFSCNLSLQLGLEDGASAFVWLQA